MLFKVTYDYVDEYVEADKFGNAIRLWLGKLQRENPGDFSDNQQPESVELISEDPVIRDTPRHADGSAVY